jgi:hypothetical protein
VPERVVELLEVIEVDEQQRPVRVFAALDDRCRSSSSTKRRRFGSPVRSSSCDNRRSSSSRSRACDTFTSVATTFSTSASRPTGASVTESQRMPSASSIPTMTSRWASPLRSALLDGRPSSASGEPSRPTIRRSSSVGRRPSNSSARRPSSRSAAGLHATIRVCRSSTTTPCSSAITRSLQTSVPDPGSSAPAIQVNSVCRLPRRRSEYLTGGHGITWKRSS